RYFSCILSYRQHIGSELVAPKANSATILSLIKVGKIYMKLLLQNSNIKSTPYDEVEIPLLDQSLHVPRIENLKGNNCWVWKAADYTFSHTDSDLRIALQKLKEVL